ncbi:MAG TPA: AmmeMemoRadiSam system protein B [Candidatus Binatia bacterium]|nr:AmmeMemoRadiSam system protein B [Candidatus Binatia bacterium]
MSGPLPSVKEPHLAGRWYPGDARALARTVADMLAAGGPPRPGVLAVLVPHAAYQYSGPTAARGFAAAGRDVRRFVVLAPSHFARFRGAAVLPMRAYRTPLGEMAIDAAAVARTDAPDLVRPNPAVFMREHALEIQLPFLQALAPDATLVPLLVGELEAGDAERLAAVVRSLAGPGTLLVASSDLTHYGRRFDYLPVPPTDAATVAEAVRDLDQGALERIVARDPDGFLAHVEATGDTICGRDAIDVVLRALPPTARGERVAYATSLDVTGDWEHTVSYAAVTFAAAA